MDKQTLTEQDILEFKEQAEDFLEKLLATVQAINQMEEIRTLMIGVGGQTVTAHRAQSFTRKATKPINGHKPKASKASGQEVKEQIKKVLRNTQEGAPIGLITKAVGEPIERVRYLLNQMRDTKEVTLEGKLATARWHAA